MSLELWWGIDLSMQQPWQGAEVSQEALVKVREDMAKAAQMGAQIAQSGQQGQQFAQLLILLLQQVTNEQLIAHIFRQLTEYKCSIPSIFAFFLPFIHEKVQLNVTSGPFVTLLQEAKKLRGGIDWILGRVKQVVTAFPQLAILSKDYRVQFILDLAKVYAAVDLNALDDAKKLELQQLLEREI